jgi:hypothetical protein
MHQNKTKRMKGSLAQAARQRGEDTPNGVDEKRACARFLAFMGRVDDERRETRGLQQQTKRKQSQGY